MRTRIGIRLILGAGLATATVIGGMAFVILRSQTTQLMAERTRSADQLSETIKSATHFDMLENRRDNLHREIRAVGGLQKEGIRKVRVFNKEGQIMFSSANEEIGTRLDPRGEACYACHAEGHPLERLEIQDRARVFRAPDGTRVLGVISMRSLPGLSSMSPAQPMLSLPRLILISAPWPSPITTAPLGIWRITDSRAYTRSVSLVTKFFIST